MNAYIVHSGSDSETIIADGFTVEPHGGVSFWAYRERTSARGTRLGRDKMLVGFYAAAPKVTLGSEGPGIGETLSELEKVQLASLIRHGDRLSQEWEKLPFQALRSGMAVLGDTAQILQPLLNRLNVEIDDTEEED